MPFESKKYGDKNLFRRVHGLTGTISANGDSVFEISIPYSECKIDTAAVVWAPEGVTADFKVLDSSTGTVSGVPDRVLNQFGFGVAVAAGYHEDLSYYDADLVAGMRIQLTIHNPTDVTKTIGFNVVLHELR